MIARSALMMMAPWLTDVAPQWSEENLFPLLSAKHPQAAIYWSARSRHSSPGQVKLFNATIADLIEVFRTLNFDAHTEQRLFGLVLTPLIFKQRGQAADFKVSFGDGRTCLRRTSAETRAHVAWEFFQMLHQTEEAQRAALWRNEIRVLFEGIWPPDAALQNVETTSSVAAMAVETEDAFPEAVAAVLPFVFPGEEGSGFGLYRVRSDERDLIARFPGAVLTLLDAMVRDSTRAPDELREILNELETAAPNLSVDPRFVRLAALIRG